MSPNKTDEFIDLFSRVRDESLRLLLRHTEIEYARFMEQFPAQAHGWENLSSALGRLVVEILPAYGRHCAATKGFQRIYTHEGATWQYLDNDYGDVNKGYPDIEKKNPYQVPGVALVSVPDVRDVDDHSSGWELYWLNDGTLLSVSRNAHRDINPGNQSSSLGIDNRWIDRTFALLPFEDMLSYITFPQLCTLLKQMFTEYQSVEKKQ